ncbi:MAG: flippase-like domain-containing protein [Phycisphaerales bacterium]|nr:flippase-like domain-containing protein [Phycisphaerales bacterium]
MDTGGRAPTPETGPAPGAKRGRTLKLAIPFVGLVVVLAVLVSVIDIREALRAIAEAELPWVAFAAGLALVLVMVSALRLRIFCLAAGERVGYRRCWSAVMASLTLNAVLPGRGGDFVKAYFLADRKGQGAVLLGVTLLERVVDVLVLAVLALIGALHAEMHGAAAAAAIVACLPIGAFLALGFAHRVPVVGAKLQRLGVAARGAAKRPGLLAGATLLATVFWGIVVLIVWSLLRAVGAGVPIDATAGATPLAVLVGVLPLTISGIGTRDGMLVLLLRDYAPGELVFAAGLLYTAISYWMLAALGLALLGRETLRKAGRADAEQGAEPPPID